MDSVVAFIASNPEFALFLCLALGYAIGSIPLGPIKIGGICGTLIVALVIGHTGVRLEAGVKDLAFALFIFSLGFLGGPQFFANIGKGWRLGVFSLIEVVTVVGLVLIAAAVLHLDQGTAAGLLAGSATESAVVGTASEAIGRLHLAPAEVSRLQANVVTAYSVTYLVGLIVIVLFASQFAPMILRINLRESAARLWKQLGGENEPTEGEAQALPDLVGRVYRVDRVAGKTVGNVEDLLNDRATVERIMRGETPVDLSPATQVEDGDRLLLIGRRDAFVGAEQKIGVELPGSPGINMTIAARDVMFSARRLSDHTIGELQSMVGPAMRHGVYLAGVERGGKHLPMLPNLKLQYGDVVRVFGAPSDVDRVATRFGRAVQESAKTDFIYLGFGVALGILAGKINFPIAGIRVTLGTGVGALVAGLVFGWTRARRPIFGNFPAAAAELFKDFGLATFIAAVGMSAGPQAMTLIRQYGVALPIMGILLVLVPACISLFVGRRFLKIEPPILLGAIAGQQCSTPAISAVQASANSSIPLIGYTVTYALSNVLLPLTGPMVVGLVGQMTR